MTEDSVENFRRSIMEHQCDNMYCNTCMYKKQSFRLLEKFLKYLPPEALELTGKGVRVLDTYMVRPTGLWKNYNKRGWYRYSSVEQFISRYISSTLVPNYDN